MKYAVLALVLAALVLAAAAVLDLAGDECEEYSFSPDRWRTDAQIEAEQIAACDGLIGSSRSDVADQLGLNKRERRDGPGGGVNVFVGEVNTGLGPGDAQNLRITFDGQDRVSDAVLSPP